MSRFPKAAALIALTVGLSGGASAADKLNLGRTATPDEIAAWDIDVRPDGLGLPEGRGTVDEGEEVFSANCAQCHGEFGEAVGRWPVLAGGQGSLQSDDPNKTIGSYWPYLSTVYDYIHRAMPFGNAQSLEPDQVYAITAYLLYMNDIVDEDFELSKENFTSVKMPNEANFFEDDRDSGEVKEFTYEPCMENCKDSVEITARAAVIDVTPDDAAARARVEKAEGTDAAPVGDQPVQQDATKAPAAPEAATDTPDPALVAAGEAVFRKCKACHELGDGATGCRRGTE